MSLKSLITIPREEKDQIAHPRKIGIVSGKTWRKANSQRIQYGPSVSQVESMREKICRHQGRASPTEKWAYWKIQQQRNTSIRPTEFSVEKFVVPVTPPIPILFPNDTLYSPWHHFQLSSPWKENTKNMVPGIILQSELQIWNLISWSTPNFQTGLPTTYVVLQPTNSLLGSVENQCFSITWFSDELFI